MKNRFVIVIAGLLVFLTALSYGQPGKRIHAHRAIRRTAAVLRYTQQQVKEHKVFTGDLARAVRHQRYARFLYRQGKYQRALHHTRRARQLAFIAIQANKGTVQKDWQPNKEEKDTGSASDKELDQELPKDSEGLTDEQLILSQLSDIDLEEAVGGGK